MKLLIDIRTGEILAEYHSEVRWPGLPGDLQDQGLAIWLEIPADCAREDVIIRLTPAPYIEANEAARAARENETISEINAFQLAKQVIRDYDDDTATPLQMKQFRKAVRFVLRKILG